MEGKKEVQEENMYTAVLTAGIVLSMVCLKHSPAMAFLFEQWRAWVFLVLNLVLLAIFFTSTHSSVTQTQDCKDHHASTSKIQESKCRKREASDFLEEPKIFLEIKNSTTNFKMEVEVEEKLVASVSQGHEEHNLFGEITAKDEIRREREEDMEPKLSNEELNERVEAFIAMFRQHLVLDERRCRDRHIRRVSSKPRQADIMNSANGSYSNMNTSAKEVVCFV